MISPLLFLLLDTATGPTPLWSDIRNASALLVLSGAIIGLFRLVILSQTRSIAAREANISQVYLEMLKASNENTRAVHAHTDVLVKVSEKLDIQHDLLSRQREHLATQVVELEEKLYDRLERRMNEAMKVKGK